VENLCHNPEKEKRAVDPTDDYENVTICLEDVEGYIREQLEDVIFILGLQVSFRLGREAAVALIQKQAAKL
jgi:hypothetical protein